MSISALAIDKALEDEAKQRLTDAKAQKDVIIRDIEEAYFFSAPNRHRAGRTTTGKDSREEDSGDLATSLAKEVAKDFATEVWNAFFPDGWAKYKAAGTIGKDDKARVEKLIEERTEKVHAAIKASNFEAGMNQALVPDGAIGTIGIYIDDVRPAEPTKCQAVPLREMEINLGPNGEVDDRFIVRNTRYRYLPVILKGVELPAATAALVKSKPNDRCQVVRGWWRDWEDEGNIAWKQVIMIGGTLVDAKKLVGAGSCPFIVARFNVDVAFAYGDGPLLETLPELRALDEAMGLTLERFDQAAHPAFVYTNDSTLNFEGGILPGTGYPAEKGFEIESLFFEGDVDTSFLIEADLERRVKRAHFVDRPEQRGDTPPSATQWIDEMALAQRRLGVPASSFWKEGPQEVFLRFDYLEMQRGNIEAIKVGDRTIGVVPYNPTERAKDQQEVQIAVRLGEIANMLFPQVAQVMIDGTKTLENLKKKLGDKTVQLRPAEEVKELMAQAMQAMQPPPGAAPPA